MVDLKAAVGGGDGLVELLAKEDVGLGHVGVDERYGRLIGRVAGDCPDDLEHGRDARAAGDHREVLAEAVRVDKLALGALDLDRVAELRLANDARDVAELVRLDEQIKVALVLVGRGRRVGPRERLAGRRNVGLDLDVLADRKAERVGLLRERVAVAAGKASTVSLCAVHCRKEERRDGHGRVVVDGDLLLEREVVPRLTVEDGPRRGLAVEEPDRQDRERKAEQKGAERRCIKSEGHGNGGGGSGGEREEKEGDDSWMVVADKGKGKGYRVRVGSRRAGGPRAGAGRASWSSRRSASQQRCISPGRPFFVRPPVRRRAAAAAARGKARCQRPRPERELLPNTTPLSPAFRLPLSIPSSMAALVSMAKAISANTPSPAALLSNATTAVKGAVAAATTKDGIPAELRTGLDVEAQEAIESVEVDGMVSLCLSSRELLCQLILR